MNNEIVVCLEKGGPKRYGRSFRKTNRRRNFRKARSKADHSFSAKGVSLTGYGLSYQGDFENDAAQSYKWKTAA